MKTSSAVLFLATLLSLPQIPSARADDLSDVLSQIPIIVNSNDPNALLKTAQIENQIIRMGSGVEDRIISVLAADTTDINIRWAAATILGEIGTAKSLATLNSIKNSDSNSWLKDLCGNAIKAIQNPSIRKGKVYVVSFGRTCEVTDPDTGDTSPCPKE